MALKNKVLILLVVMALCSVCSGALHKVGGSDGWTFLDYTMWSSTKDFHVNDTLYFSYNNKFHSVLQVTKQDFISCNTSSPIAVHRSGTDMITLPKHGHYYFVDGAPGHCEAGQKVHIRVTELPAAAAVPHGCASASPTPHPSSSGAPSAGSSPNLVLAIACLVLMFSKFIV